MVIANGFHVNALPHSRSECGAALVRRFMSDLDTGDESCAAAVPPVRLVPQFARHAARTGAAHGLPGNEAPAEALRVVTAALLTARMPSRAPRTTVPARAPVCAAARYAVTRVGAGYHLRLRNARFTEELSVSGSVHWPGRSGEVRGCW